MKTVTGRTITVPLSFRLGLPDYLLVTELAQQRGGGLSAALRDIVRVGLEEVLGKMEPAVSGELGGKAEDTSVALEPR